MRRFFVGKEIDLTGGVTTAIQSSEDIALYKNLMAGSVHD
jgi:hypothetical protein